MAILLDLLIIILILLFRLLLACDHIKLILVETLPRSSLNNRSLVAKATDLLANCGE